MDLEQMATTKVTSVIAKTNRLKAYINSGDKEPSFDGNIYIYSNDIYAKTGTLKQVSVQVKGKSTTAKKVRDNIKYPISVKDLNIYMNNGGTMFFVVYIDTNTREAKQIYYSALLPFKIKELLKINSSKSKNIGVRFKKFPEDVNSITNIFLNFYLDAQKQISFVGKEIPTLEDLAKSNQLKSISFGYINSVGNVCDNELPALFEGNEMYIYANTKDGYAPIPIEYYANVEKICMSTDNALPITVNGVKYYDALTKIITVDKIIYKIGTCVSITIPNMSFKYKAEKNFDVHVTVKIKGTLKQRILALEFLSAMFQEKSFEINGCSFPMNFTDKQLEKLKTTQYPEWLETHRKAQRMLDKLKVKKDLNLDKCDENDISRLNSLISAVEDGTAITNLSSDTPLIAKYKIGNLVLSLVFKKNEDGSYNIWNFFDTFFPVAQEVDGVKIPTSQFSILTAEDIVILDNINFKSIIDDYYRLDTSDVLMNSANLLMLEFVKAYDIKNDKNFLDVAKQLLEFQKEHREFLNVPICEINELQITLRERPLNFGEKRKLYKIIDETDDKHIQAGAYLLLDEQEEATKVFETMEEEHLKNFKYYPIYKFYKDS